MQACPDESLVLRYLGGEARERAGEIESHVDRCASCRAWLAGLACTSIGLDAAMPSLPRDPLALGEHLPVGAEVGRYRVTGVLGRGGMGVVYEAEDPALHRRVALKVLRTAIAGTARLLAEARTMARLSHPNVCPVFDVGALGDRWFLAMAFVEGGTLAQWLDRAERHPHEIVAMFVQAGRGLQAAHALGVVHRDFKPTNVLIDAGERAVVCDFGLAASEQGTTLPTGGTPRYMPPEQTHGGGDARVDQFAFGVALRDALGGKPIGRALRAAIARATDPDPERRFVDMRALLDAIGRTERSPARRWLPALAIGGVLVAAGVALPGAARTDAEAEPSAKPEVSAQVQALLDESIEFDRASDPRGSVPPLDRAIELARTSGDQAGLALAHAARGSQLGKIARYTEAIDDLERSFNLATQIDRTDIAADAAIIRVGLLAQELGRADEALTWGRHVESILGRDHTLELRLRADFEQVMGRVHYHRRELDLAHARYVRAIELLRTDQPLLERHLASALMLLGQTEMLRGELEAARTAIVEAVALAEHVHGPDHPDVGAAIGNLAGITAELGDFDEAHRLLERSRKITVAAHGDRHPNVLAIDASVAALWMRRSKHAPARTRLEDALLRAPPELPITCTLHEQLGVTLGRLGLPSEARGRVQGALDCFAAIFGEDSAEAAGARLALAELGREKRSDSHATGSPAEPPAPRDP